MEVTATEVVAEGSTSLAGEVTAGAVMDSAAGSVAERISLTDIVREKS